MKLHCNTWGHGPHKVLALHGWLSDSSIFDGLMPYLDPEHFTVAGLDFRGYGGSRHLAGAHDVAEMATDVVDTAQALGWARFHLVGHSMGGMVLQKVMLATPARVASAVAITPVAASGFELDDASLRHFRAAAHDDAALASIFDHLTGARHAPSVLARWVARTRERTTLPAFLGYLHTWTSTDFSADLHTLDAPLLAITGAHDGALGASYVAATYLQQLRQVQHADLPGAGHYPMLETPPALATLVDRFLRAKASPT